MPKQKIPGNAVPIATRTLSDGRPATPGSVKATPLHGMARALVRAEKSARRRRQKRRAAEAAKGTKYPGSNAASRHTRA